MPSPKNIATLWVRTPTARYPVWVGHGVLRRAGRRLAALRPAGQSVFVISSPRVWGRWGRELTRGLRAGGLRGRILLMDDRETNKRLRTVERLAERLLACGANRNAVLVALGGGVVGDVTGYLAASYMRGVDYVQIPTTLVGQIDSALGGKTGVNLRGGKNLLGAFHHPAAVLADSRTLATLPAREFRAGLYEVVKCAILGDAALFRLLEANMVRVRKQDAKLVPTILLRCLRLKARLVGRDERDAGERRLLNLGHTFGHAFESLAGYRRLRHGEAVGWGLLAATLLAVGLDKLKERDAARIIRVVQSVGRLPDLPRTSAARVYARLFSDKKATGRELQFVLPRRIGKAEIVRGVPRRAVLAVLRELPRLGVRR